MTYQCTCQCNCKARFDSAEKIYNKIREELLKTKLEFIILKFIDGKCRSFLGFCEFNETKFKELGIEGFKKGFEILTYQDLGNVFLHSEKGSHPLHKDFPPDHPNIVEDSGNIINLELFCGDVFNWGVPPEGNRVVAIHKNGYTIY